jgi:hypothetical protein
VGQVQPHPTCHAGRRPDSWNICHAAPQALHQWYEDQTGYLAEEANNLQQQQAQQQQQGTQPGPSRGGSQRQQQQGGKGSTKTPAGKTPGRATRGKAAAALPGEEMSGCME